MTSDSPPTPATSATAASAAVVALEHVDVVLSGRRILTDVTFSLERGQFAGLIGSNGAGKTTLMRVVLGLIAPTSGSVTIAAKSRRGAARIGYVPQKVAFDAEMPLRGRDVVGLGLDGNRFGFPLRSATRRARIDEMLEAVGATGFADARVGALSGGEQQRILIAHALISDPALLLLDEPLANLDIRSEQEVVELLARIAREKQVAVLISTYDMNPLLPVMDRVVYVAGGRVATGKTADVVTTEALTRLYGHHVDVIHIHDRVVVIAARHDGTAAHGGAGTVVEVI